MVRQKVSAKHYKLPFDKQKVRVRQRIRFCDKKVARPLGVERDHKALVRRTVVRPELLAQLQRLAFVD